MSTIVCTVCGATTAPVSGLCGSCDATPRQRALALGVLRALKRREVSVQTCKMDKSREGLGITDWFGLAAILANRFAYTNSFLHKFPMLDISAPPAVAVGQFEFCTCSDVLEHVLPPVSKAFAGLFALLKPGGAAIVSVPTTEQVSGIYEKYPNLYEFRTVENRDGSYRLVNITRDGTVETFHRPNFHGGPGTTLEMRCFSWDGFLTALRDAGFVGIESIETVPEHGIPGRPLSGNVVIARKPA